MPTVTILCISSVLICISMGTALAMILSYSVNESIIWAIIHGVLSWFYVLYFALFK